MCPGGSFASVFQNCTPDDVANLVSAATNEAHRKATTDRVNRVASTYCLQQAEKCRQEAARATDDDIRAHWKEAERCWLALGQHGGARPWPFVSKETEKSD